MGFRDDDRRLCPVETSGEIGKAAQRNLRGMLARHRTQGSNGAASIPKLPPVRLRRLGWDFVNARDAVAAELLCSV